MPLDSSLTRNGAGRESGIPVDTSSGFLTDICVYFRDFLDTDFKRQASPKRGITLRDPIGNLTGISLEKYPDLAAEVWRFLRKPVGDGSAFSLAIPRGKFRSRVTRSVATVVERYANAIADGDIEAIADRCAVVARGLKSDLENDPHHYGEAVIAAIRGDLVRTVVAPLVTRLEGELERARGDAYEAIYNIEEELGERLVVGLRGSIESALATALVDGSFDELDRKR